MRYLNKNINYIHCRLLLMAFMSISLNSCITNKLVIENDLQDPSKALIEIYDKVEAGDWITLKANNRYYSRLQVVSIKGSQMKVRQHLLDHSMVYHYVNLEYIQELKRVETEARYPVGVPVTILIVLFYLLV